MQQVYLRNLSFPRRDTTMQNKKNFEEEISLIKEIKDRLYNSFPFYYKVFDFSDLIADTHSLGLLLDRNFGKLIKRSIIPNSTSNVSIINITDKFLFDYENGDINGKWTKQIVNLLETICFNNMDRNFLFFQQALETDEIYPTFKIERFGNF